MTKKLNRPLVVYLAALIAAPSFATDVYLASMPTIQYEFSTSPAHVQLTLSLFFVAFAVMQLVWGSLSDRIGRKPVIFTGLTIFTLASVACAWTQNIAPLIITRIVQAIGACAGTVMALAVVKDRLQDAKALAKVLGFMMSTALLAPMIAPIIGSYLLVHFHWQANFYFLAFYGATLFFGTCFIQESHQNRKQPLKVSELLSAHIEQFKNGPFLLATAAVTTNFAIVFAFISSSSFIYIKIYQQPSDHFGYFFAINASALILGSLTISWLKDKLSDRCIIICTLTISLFGSLLMLLLNGLWPTNIWTIVGPAFVVTYGSGILYPELTSQALKHVVRYTGLTSSLIGSCRFTLAATVGFLMGFLITTTAYPLAVMMLILTLLTISFSAFYFRIHWSKSGSSSDFKSIPYVGIPR